MLLLLLLLFVSGNLWGSRLEYNTLRTNGIVTEMSVEVKTTSSYGIIFFANHPNGSDVMAVYLNEGRVMNKSTDYPCLCSFSRVNSTLILP